MNTDQPSLLDFVKATSDPDRLRIIGALSRGPLTAAQVAAAIDLPFRKAFNHLAFLEFVGLVLPRAGAEREARYELDEQFLEKIARQHFEGRRPSYLPAPDAGKKARRVLAAHLNPDGTIATIPLQPAKLRVILDYLIAAFETGQVYTEKEVNAILARFNEDTSGLRRDLVDAGMLMRERDGSKYWRPA